MRNPRHTKTRRIENDEEARLNQRDHLQDVDATAQRYLGPMNERCEHCGALFFAKEKKDCCTTFNQKPRNDPNAPVAGNPPSPPPYPFIHWFRHPETAALIRQNSRKLNAALAMSSAVTHIEANVAPFTYKIHGALHHLVSKRLDPAVDRHANNHKYLNWYIYDHAEADKTRHFEQFFANDTRERQWCYEMFRTVDNFIRIYNPIALQLSRVPDLRPAGANDEQQAQLILLGDMDGRNGHERRYNTPEADEVAIVLPAGDPNGEDTRQLQVWWQNRPDANLQRLTDIVSGDANAARVVRLPIGPPPPGPAPILRTQRIHETHMLWDPLRFVLMFPYGSRGWGIDLQNKWTQEKYSRYWLATRNISLQQNSIMDCNAFGKLYLEYLVDQYVKIESCRLAWIRHNQGKIRADLYQNVETRLAEGIQNPQEIGHRVILPGSFQSSPRDLINKYHDAMAAARTIGNPQLFITLTANPQWREVIENLRQGETPQDRPDLVNRVFHMKLKQLLESLGAKDPEKHRFYHLLGRCRFVVHVIEFQKRGLPHAHILITYSNAITPEIADLIASAELPDPQLQPQLFAAVSQKLMHVCGVGRCLDEHTHLCKRKFPKPYVDATYIDDKGQLHLRRRNNPDNTVRKRVQGPNGTTIDAALGNSFVVANCPQLTMEFDAHINVEIVNGDPKAPPNPSLFKYLMDYLFKGGDRIVAGITLDNEQLDEITQFVDSRYVSSTEAHWRLMEFAMRRQKPACLSLPVHLPGQNFVQFTAEQLQNDQIMANKAETMLTQFFAFNTARPDLRHLLYADFPRQCTWNVAKRRWTYRQRSQKFETVGRLAWVHPRMPEPFYLRLLLMHVTGPKSFEDLRTVDGVVYPTFQAAAQARGLADNGLEWRHALDQAVAVMTSGRQLRQFFCDILNLNSETIENPTELWELYANEISADIQYQIRNLPEFQQAPPSEDDVLHDAKILALRVIRDSIDMPDMLNRLPTADGACRLRCSLTAQQRVEVNRLLMHELSLDAQQQRTYCENATRALNPEQRAPFQRVYDAFRTQTGALILLNAPGGTGKTFVLKTILAFFRGPRPRGSGNSNHRHCC